MMLMLFWRVLARRAWSANDWIAALVPGAHAAAHRGDLLEAELGERESGLARAAARAADEDDRVVAGGGLEGTGELGERQGLGACDVAQLADELVGLAHVDHADVAAVERDPFGG